jgi:hypothetical protein
MSFFRFVSVAVFLTVSFGPANGTDVKSYSPHSHFRVVQTCTQEGQSACVKAKQTCDDNKTTPPAQCCSEYLACLSQNNCSTSGMVCR